MTVTNIESEDALKKFLEDNSGKLVVIDFFAQWCGPCKMIGPKVVQMAKEMDTVAFAKVDVDELEEVAQQYEVSAMPTFIFIRNCQKVDTLTGANDAKLREKIENLK